MELGAHQLQGRRLLHQLLLVQSLEELVGTLLGAALQAHASTIFIVLLHFSNMHLSRAKHVVRLERGWFCLRHRAHLHPISSNHTLATAAIAVASSAIASPTESDRVLMRDQHGHVRESNKHHLAAR